MRALIPLLLIFSSCNNQSAKIPPAAKSQNLKFETLLQREDVIWGFDFLPQGKIILTERGGRMLIFDPKSNTTVALKGVPKVYDSGQAGLLDVRVHPEFSKNNIVYFTYSEKVGDEESTTALGTAVLKDNELINFKQLFRGLGPNSNDIHYGSRIEFDGTGHLFVSMGDRDERNKAQDLSYHQGKILRLNLDGSVPQDNPYAKLDGNKPEIWSYGHRNPQGLTKHPETGELWEAEMGPKGGDEVNLINPQVNYGWPIVTYGKEYWGPKIGQTEKSGTQQPVVYWVPSISPSALTFYSGDRFPEWKNDLFIATLSGTHIHRVVLEKSVVKKQEELLGDLGYRWRSVRTGPDGYLYAGTDEGKFGRLVRH